MYEWDEAKRLATLNKRDIDFADMARFEWDTAHIIEDTRQPYPERHLIALGMIDYRLHFCVWTARRQKIRIISLRKANKREEKAYDQAKTTH